MLALLCAAKPDKIETNPMWVFLLPLSLAFIDYNTCTQSTQASHSTPRVPFPSSPAQTALPMSPQLMQKYTPFWIGSPLPSLHFVLWFMGLK